jgi:hypothetical protein
METQHEEAKPAADHSIRSCGQIPAGDIQPSERKSNAITGTARESFRSAGGITDREVAFCFIVVRDVRSRFFMKDICSWGAVA